MKRSMSMLGGCASSQPTCGCVPIIILIIQPGRPTAVQDVPRSATQTPPSPVLSLMEMDCSGGAELCSSLQVPASTQLCHETPCQCRGFANTHQALQDVYKPQTLNNCTPFWNIFPKPTISRAAALQSSPCLCDLRASFFLLQQICFLPVFVFLGTAAAQSMARASCQPRFSKSLHVAG